MISTDKMSEGSALNEHVLQVCCSAALRPKGEVEHPLQMASQPIQPPAASHHVLAFALFLARRLLVLRWSSHRSALKPCCCKTHGMATSCMHPAKGRDMEGKCAPPGHPPRDPSQCSS